LFSTNTTLLALPGNSTDFGQNVTFVATVKPDDASAGTPDGTVQFVIDGSNFGSPVALSGDSASISDAALSVGTHSVEATYSGNSDFGASSGALAGDQTVTPSSRTVISSSVNPSLLGQNVTFTATISAVSPGAGTPGGTVQFSIDGSNYGSPVALSGDNASISDASLSAGTHRVSADYSGDSNFSASRDTLPGDQAVFQINISGSGQSAPVSTAFPSPLVVTIHDNANNPVRGLFITLAAPVSGASASFSNGVGGISGITDANGQVAEVVTANNVAGSYAVTVSVNAASTPVFFGLTNTPTPVDHLMVTPLNTSTVAGQPVLFTVQAADAAGNPAGAGTGLVTFTTTDPQAPTLPGGLLNSSGFGFFAAPLKTVAGGPWTITATAGTFTGTSAAITVTPGPATKLAFGAQPLGSPTGVRLPTVAVQILDAYGNVVTSDNSDVVTVAVASGPGPFSATSTTSATVHNGVATLNNLTLVKPGTYTLSELASFLYTGPNSTAFTVAPLQVVPGSFAGGPSGFSLQFSARAFRPGLRSHGARTDRDPDR
jgi:hypothetical protein